MTIETETLAAAGLDADAEILVDRWGIPHMYAQSPRDAFFVQGFNAARDRLWQIDLWRKRGLGLLAKDFGPAYAERDRAARLLIYRGDMEAEWGAYGIAAKAWTQAFVEGINAWIDLVEREPERLPPEFRLTGTAPARWEAEDVVRCRAHARVRNLEYEVLRTTIADRFGLEADGLHRKLEPSHRPVRPEGLPPGPVPPEVLKTYLAATEPVAFGADRLDRPLAPVDIAPVDIDTQGSNNWALTPARTTTGRAILASDPHRAHEHPSLRYIAHLCAPGLHVIGAGEPAVPGVSFGHNERIAFGLTIWPADQEDLYVYELSPDDPDLYRYGEGWERMRVVTETIEVHGAPARHVELRFTRHGPVLHRDPEARRAWAVRTVWTAPGTAAYLASLNYVIATSWDEFVAAMDGWGAPSANQVYADVDGNVGWIGAGHVPVRPNWDGLMPVPGDGRYEWAGFLDKAAHPRLYNPERGWVASANQMNHPEGFAHATCYEWSDGARYARVVEGLEARERHSIDDAKALQTDFASVSARRLTALLAGLSADDPDTARALDLLRGWDCRLGPESGPAALFEIWFMQHLVPETLRRLGPPGLAEMIAAPDTALIVDLVEAAGPAFGGDAATARDALLLDTLAAAMRATAERLGPEPAGWAWGRLHHGYFEHALSPVAAPDWRAKLDVGPAPKGGSGLTVNNNGYRAADFRVVHGVSWRMVVDVGDWDRCWTVNAPGQSGDPRSPHYRDLFEVWAREDYVPMLFSRAAVEAAAERRILVRPA
ncbi:MAG: penicillin acylase family protein [Alphaproteobacteria bacterium]